ENFWARGYFVTTIGHDEEMVMAYVRNQDKEDAHYDQLKLGM
ncbi:MAG: IS200/IS605 family transposase, partial [Methylophilaceae bacterium]